MAETMRAAVSMDALLSCHIMSYVLYAESTWSHIPVGAAQVGLSRRLWTARDELRVESSQRTHLKCKVHENLPPPEQQRARQLLSRAQVAARQRADAVTSGHL